MCVCVYVRVPTRAYARLRARAAVLMFTNIYGALWQQVFYLETVTGPLYAADFEIFPLCLVQTIVSDTKKGLCCEVGYVNGIGCLLLLHSPPYLPLPSLPVRCWVSGRLTLRTFI